MSYALPTLRSRLEPADDASTKTTAENISPDDLLLQQLGQFARQEKSEPHKEGFWWQGTGRRIVTAAVFFSGYYLSEQIQRMDTAKFYQLADLIRNTFNKLGLEPNTDFFRFQMSDFFSAAYLVFAQTALTWIYFKSGQEQKLLGKDESWWEKNSENVGSFLIAILLAIFEVIQAYVQDESVNIKDMVTYLAGIGVIAGSPMLWREYLVFKNVFKHKVKPFMAKRGAKITGAYLRVVGKTREKLPSWH